VGAIQGLKDVPMKLLDLPVLFPADKACILCMKCTRGCPTGALSPIEGLSDMAAKKLSLGSAKIHASRCIKISMSCSCRLCIKVSKTCICRLCYDVCPLRDKAITLARGTLHPRIDSRACLGCGLCAQYCPERAIEIVPRVRRER